MKLIFVGLAFLATAYAYALNVEYLPPVQEAEQSIEVSTPSNEYLAPETEEATVLADDGYRYKTVRRFRNRNRRDVNELPSSEYLPPTEEAVEVAAPSTEYLAPAAEEATVLADDGYRYKTVRRFRNRNRRDVNELPNSEYLPPKEGAVEVAAPSTEYLAPVTEDATVLADDGYRYKTVLRFRNRNRRDVNELPSTEYLPPTEEAVEVAAPSTEYLAPAAEEATVLADDGYRYKTVRRFRNRNRRDVNELPSSEYLPPTEEAVEVAAPSTEYLAPAAEGATVLADDGYRYKTVRRLRNRRDVNELPSSEYLPPAQESTEVAAPSTEYLAPATEEATVLADDGYRYKTVLRFRNRNRRDVNELPSSEYLPPTEEAVEVAAPSTEYLAPATEEATVLADDGYRYKTIRRFRNRNRRDVNELPSSEYLPPTEEAVEVAAPSNEYLAPAAEEGTVLADDGYRYKTIRRFRNRNRRDVNELPSSEYLPPTEEAVEVAAPSKEYLAPAAEEATVLADDGYRYKTVRRFRNRNRRDVNELPSSEYLPPTEEAVEVAAPSNEYLAPAAEEGTVLADDGYRYKTVRRFRNRNRRDVNELTSSEYLPPTEESTEVAVPSTEYLAPAAEEATVLADDGYRYKTVRRFRNRNRRDVNELPSSEYLPPTAETVDIAAPSVEYLAPAEEEATSLAKDGYRYKTVKKFKIRRH